MKSLLFLIIFIEYIMKIYIISLKRALENRIKIKEIFQRSVEHRCVVSDMCPANVVITLIIVAHFVVSNSVVALTTHALIRRFGLGQCLRGWMLSVCVFFCSSPFHLLH